MVVASCLMKKGDLVHIPQGSVLRIMEDEDSFHLSYPKDIFVTAEPSIGIYIDQRQGMSMHRILFNNQIYYASNNSIYEMKRNNKDDNKIS